MQDQKWGRRDLVNHLEPGGKRDTCLRGSEPLLTWPGLLPEMGQLP